MSGGNLKIVRIDSRRDDIRQAMAQLRQRLSPQGNVVSEAGRQRTIDVFGEALTPVEVVQRICRDVGRDGLDAVLDYSARIDRATLTAETIRVPREELAEAHAGADAELLETVRRIRSNIEEFQRAILHSDVRIERPGGYLRQRYRPLRRVGICVPGGAAAYPSTVLMTAVPAQVAGVEQLAVVAPPTKFGSYNADMLAVCHELGIDEVYRMGGAQAVAALAYGVQGIPRVDKIVGPGNLFVALAKRHVYGEVDIDSIAGPSEVVVIVDASTRADYTAADLIAQAEHAPGASVLIGWDAAALDSAVAELDRQLDTLERGDLARQSLEDFGAVILARDADEACALADEIAPEHLHIATEDAERLAEQIPHAGAIFLGNYTPVALGDYAAGPSHVLPTSGTARFASGLSANDFLRSGSILHFDRQGMTNLAGDVRTLATKEGLTAHRASVEIRLDDED
ncbi:MAG: histidinol dehydrogenase [Candidatus Nealsonbacteria bacterium]|nr:histidinol dehydrogenase [Candidatus Nealsonbacteria bacterium]